MLNIERVSYAYSKESVLNTVSFFLKKGAHLAVMGESGSGKSTLLKAIYGLLHLDKGKIVWDGNQIMGPNYSLVPGEKSMRYVSQDFDLMPVTSVSENIAKHLSVFEQETHDSRIDELLQIVGLREYKNSKVKYLSVGQKQRVALARALAQEPELLLLDEPFSSIDQFKKHELRHRLFPYLKAKGITVITATHDADDVLPFSDMVLVIKNGYNWAYRPTLSLYQNPRDSYVASLFGQVNELPIRLLKEYAKQEQSILVYPHEFEISSKSGVEITVKRSFFKGSHYLTEGIAENGQSILFHSKKKLDKGILAYLNIPLNLVNLRMKTSD